MQPEKINLIEVYPSYYQVETQPIYQEFEPIHYIRIEGKGSPENAQFQNSIHALFKVAELAKSIAQKVNRDFLIPNLEGIWWHEEDKDILFQPKESWNWYLQIRMPDYILKSDITRIINLTKHELPLVEKVQFALNDAQPYVQALHIGSYKNESYTIDKLKAFAMRQGLKLNGNQHEIYLTDPRETEEANLKTIIKYPVISTTLN